MKQEGEEVRKTRIIVGGLPPEPSGYSYNWLLSLLQKCFSTEIPSNYPRESGGTGFPACADKGLNLMDIIWIFFIKSIL
jgi:hypothetical protein